MKVHQAGESHLCGVLHSTHDELLTPAYVPARLSLDVFFGLSLLKLALRRFQHHVADFTGKSQR